MRKWHTILRMKQDIDALIRQRIRALRLARGWSLDVLARSCFLSPSTLSRIETGDRRIALDQLVPIARALETTLDELVSSEEDEDVVIRPQPAHRADVTTWLLSRDRAAAGVAVVKTRLSAGAAPLPSSRNSHAARARTTGSADVSPAAAVVTFCCLPAVASAKAGARSSAAKTQTFITG